MDDHDKSSSFRSQAPRKAFVFGRVACLMLYLPTHLGLRLWEILLACLKQNDEDMVDVADVVDGDPFALIDGEGEVHVDGHPPALNFRRQRRLCRS